MTNIQELLKKYKGSPSSIMGYGVFNALNSINNIKNQSSTNMNNSSSSSKNNSGNGSVSGSNSTSTGSNTASSSGNTEKSDLEKWYSSQSDVYKNFLDEQNKLLDSQYNQTKLALDDEKKIAAQSAAILNEKLMKYLPQQLRNAGLGTSGVMAGATTDAYNNYMSNLSNISGGYQSALAQLDQGLASDKLTNQATYLQQMADLNNSKLQMEREDQQIADQTNRQDQNTIHEQIGNEIEAMYENAIADNVLTEEEYKQIEDYANKYSGGFNDAMKQSINAKLDRFKMDVNKSQNEFSNIKTANVTNEKNSVKEGNVSFSLDGKDYQFELVDQVSENSDMESIYIPNGAVFTYNNELYAKVNNSIYKLKRKSFLDPSAADYDVVKIKLNQ